VVRDERRPHRTQRERGYLAAIPHPSKDDGDITRHICAIIKRVRTLLKQRPDPDHTRLIGGTHGWPSLYKHSSRNPTVGKS
jgi:hypothetical protein